MAPLSIGIAGATARDLVDLLRLGGLDGSKDHFRSRAGSD